MPDEASRLARMETTLELVRDQIGKLVESITVVTQLQMEQAHTQEALSRAFARIESQELAARKHEEDERRVHDALEEKTGKLEMRMNTYVAWVSGIMLGVSGAMGTLAWVISNNIVGALQAVVKSGALH